MTIPAYLFLVGELCNVPMGGGWCLTMGGGLGVCKVTRASGKQHLGPYMTTKGNVACDGLAKTSQTTLTQTPNNEHEEKGTSE